MGTDMKKSRKGDHLRMVFLRKSYITKEKSMVPYGTRGGKKGGERGEKQKGVFRLLGLLMAWGV